MRQLIRRALPQRGLTLIEVMVGLTIASLLALAAAPSLSDYSLNARLRENGNLLFAEALYAQSEAIKRNQVVRLSASGASITVADLSDPANPVVLRTRPLSGGVQMGTGTVSFNSSGWTSTLTAVSINLSHPSATCSAETRCPGLRVEAGGAIQLCKNQLSC
jgi:type IV fimbrial biogenesis protein FimT